MKVIDLYCGAGGASKGLSEAGFEVTGVDIKRSKNYPFKFIEGDALEADCSGFDLIWASPPCQAYTIASKSQRNAGKIYPDLMGVTREKLITTGIPFIIENTPGAPMRVDIILCGSMFGLRVIRHRWFECSFPIFRLFPTCQHHRSPITVCGTGTTSWNRAKNGGKCHTIQEMRDAMGIQWMNRGELSQAIPPVYSKYLAEQFLLK